MPANSNRKYSQQDAETITATLLEEADQGITFSGLDPLLGSLGELVGLLTGAGQDKYALDKDWFSDPINNIKNGVTDNPEKFSAVLGQLLGKVGGNALGIPVTDPALLGTWYPISYGGKTTGFYLVSYPKGNETVLGLGVLHTWKVPENNTLLKVNVWGLVPFVRIGNGGFAITFTSPGYPIVAGVAAEGADSNGPLVDINGVSFNGVKFSASVDFAASNPFDVSLEVLALQLPGDAKPTNRSLADLAAITGDQILETAASLFVGALSKAFPGQEQRIRYLPALLGMSTQVPNSDVKMPILEWYKLFYNASNSGTGGPAAIFVNWFNTVSSNNDLLKTWLTCLSGFLQNAVGEVTGTGTRIDPFKVTLLTISSIGSLGFTVGTFVQEDTIRNFYPGLSFTGAPIGFGTADTVLLMEADLELAQFQLSAGAASFTPTIEFVFRMALQNKTAGQPLASAAGYSFGSLQGGLSLGLSGKPIPYFQLNQVTTPYSSFQNIDLLSPSELAKSGAAVLSDAIKSLLGVSATGTGPAVGNNIAALIGLIAPGEVAADWPASLLPPFSTDGMVTSITNPIGAWADYYWKTLQPGSVVEGKLAFTYLLEQLAALIQKTTGVIAISVTGNGTPDEPWMAGISVADMELPAYLTAYQQTIDGKLKLVMGLQLAPEITLAGVKIIPSLQLNAISLLFPAQHSTDAVVADWLPDVAVRLSLPEGLTTPAVGGITVSVDASQLSGGWNRSSGWSWSMFVNNPVLTVYGHQVPLGQNLNFSDQDSLENLVKQGSTAFSTFLVSALGASLIRSETRAGLFATGALGLLTDLSLSPIFPAGLQWQNFTQLTITSFTNPWPDIRNLIAANFSTPEKAASLLSLLSWTVNSNMTEAPAITGSGTIADPWMTPMPFGFSLPVWYDTANNTIGTGIGRQDVFNYTLAGKKFRFTLNSSLGLTEYSLATGSFVNNPALPNGNFVGTLSDPDGLLVDLGPLGSVEKIALGFSIGLSNGTVSFTPVVNLTGVTLAGQQRQDLLTLDDFTNHDFTANLQSSFLNLLNQGIQIAIAQVKDQPLFQNAYELLQLLGLTLERNAATDPYGISSAGWQALLAGPKNYITTQLNTLLTEAASRRKLFSFLQTVLHIKLPPLPEPALLLLYGLDICGTKEDGFPLDPQALLEILSSPVSSIQNRFTALVNNREKLTQITVALAQNIGSQQFGNFNFSSTTNGLVRLEVLPANAYAIGPFVKLFGALVFDINNLKLTVETDAYCPPIGLTLQSSIGIQYQDSVFMPSFTSQIIWGDGSKPSALPLQLYPFDGNTFMNQLAALAPAYTLNIVLNAIFEEQLLKKYPLVQKVFTGLGLGKYITAPSSGNLQAAGSGLWQMDSIMGILRDPLGWILSDAVLGQNGKFSVAKLIQLLSNLPAVNYKGISLAPVAGSGVNITGFPYGFGISMTGNDGIATFSFNTESIDIANGTARLSNLTMGLSLDQDYQPSFTGGFNLGTGANITPAFYSAISYNKGFGLTIGSGTPQTPGSISLQLLPFLGWGKLVEQAAQAAAAALLNELVPVLLNQLESKGGALADFVTRLRSFGNTIDVASLVNSFTGILTQGGTQAEILAKLETAGLDWLKLRFSQQGAPSTVTGIITLLSGQLPTQLSADGGRLVFKPSPSLPIAVKAGLNGEDLLGLWVDLTLPGTELLKVNIAETGVGVNINNGAVNFDFGVTLIVPVDQDTGPALALEYVNGTGFVLSIDPLGDQANPSVPSSLSRQLLPVFFPKQTGDPDSLGERMTDWLLLVIKNVLPQYVSALVLNQSSVKTWLDSPIIAQPNAPTPGLLLTASMIIVSKDDRYYLNTLENLAAITPKTFFGNLLQTLMQNKLTLLTFGAKNQCSITIGPKKGAPDYFGVVIAAPDLTLDFLPGMTLQLGATNTDWITGSKGEDGDPGIGFFLPITVDGQSNVNADFEKFDVMLYNVGFDYTGKDNQPLVNLERFKIGAVQPRVLFEMDFGAVAPKSLITFGAGINLQDIALSLAPNTLAGSGGTNPIASNMLGAGDDSSSAKNPPANPSFSVTAAYCKELYINLKSNTGNGHEVIIPIERGFGPLFIESLGLGWENDKRLLDFIFNGDLTLAGLKASLIGLRVGIPVTDPTNFNRYTVDLDGIDISFKGGSVSVQAGLLKQDSPLSYTGLAVIKAASFSLSAIGSYAELDNGNGGTSPSLFVFGALNAPLGGVPAFFITGVAAGFAYNRGLKIPDISEVQNFPLVRGVVDGTFDSGESPGSALQKINDVIYPEIGQYWIAAGLKFTSFQLLNSAGLLFISFGKDFEINLLGLTYASMPPMVDKSLALAYFELALKVSFKPSAGIISAEAQLTPNSFVLSKDCKITGGFAFYLWYKNITTSSYSISAGDFVITLGGYHPAFNKPAWYPDVPRLGMQWKMDVSVGSIGISGGTYFALCPTAVMTGGYLNVRFEAGPLKAWLNAYANMLIEWNPFYFNVGIGITVGVSFGFTVAGVSITLSVELGAKLELEGPPVHGKVEVDWYIISFTIPIGSGDNATTDDNLNWAGFAQSFLPPPTTQPQGASAMLDAADAVVQQVVKWNTGEGLLSTANDTWLIKPVPFTISATSAIPSSQITVTGTSFSLQGKAVGVRPMGYTASLQSPVTISVINSAGQPEDLVARKIILAPTQNGAPAALWSKDKLDRQQAPDPATMLLPDALFGLMLVGADYDYFGNIPAFVIGNLAYTRANPIRLPYAGVPAYAPALRYPAGDQDRAYSRIKSSIMAATTIDKRNAVFAALAASEITAPLSPDLTVMAASADLVLQAMPVIARVGIYQNNGQPDDTKPQMELRTTTITDSATTLLAAPKLVGTLRRYASKSTGGLQAAAANSQQSVRSQWSLLSGTIKKTGLARSLAGILPPGQTLYNGGLGLWAVDDRGSSTLRLNGALPVTVSCFDRHGELLLFRNFAMKAAAPGKTATSSFKLPAQTAQVVVQGCQSANGVQGCQHDTMLCKVNDAWAVGDHVLVRVQNSQRIAARSADGQKGLVEMQTLLRRNLCKGPNNVLQQGWIQALLPADCRYIAVLLDDVNAAADSLEMSLQSGILPTAAAMDEPVDQQTMPNGRLFVFEAPPAGSAAWTGLLLKTVKSGVQVISLLGMQQPGDWKNSKHLIPGSNALNLTDTTFITTKIGITTK